MVVDADAVRPVIVVVIMRRVVAVDGESRCGLTKQSLEGRIIGDVCGRADTANMTIQADNAVCCGHDQMQVVR